MIQKIDRFILLLLKERQILKKLKKLNGIKAQSLQILNHITK